MSIKITRNSGYMASEKPLTIYAHGKEKAKIKDRETLQLNLKKYPAKVQVRSFDMKSNEIEVHTGEELIIKRSLGMPILFGVCILGLVIGNFLLESPFIPLIIVTFLYILLSKKVTTFKIEKTKTREEN